MEMGWKKQETKGNTDHSILVMKQLVGKKQPGGSFGFLGRSF
jgi:hypothetical protein